MQRALYAAIYNIDRVLSPRLSNRRVLSLAFLKRVHQSKFAIVLFEPIGIN